MRELERRESDTNGATPTLDGATITVVRTLSDLRRELARARRAGRTIGLVPTMGAFHEGHLSLVRAARSQCDMVVVSLFVNPTQFAAGEDLQSYPRDERRDLALAEREGADLLFAPGVEEVYPEGFATTVEVSGLTDVLCGAPGSRGPAHFQGVTTVVAKLLNMCGPHVAYFGQKDFQQTLVIKRLVRDLDIPVRIEVCPTVRDADGLALSSRNAYLSGSEREQALSLKQALDAAEASIASGAPGAEALTAARERLDRAGVEPEYLEILRAGDLLRPHWEPGESLVVAIAARVGGARLIDNTLLQLPVNVSEPAPT